MKTFDNLSELEKQAAIKLCQMQVCIDIGESKIVFRNDDPLADAVEKAFNKAENDEVPWFVTDYLMQNAIVKNFINTEGLQTAKETLYLEDEEFEPSYLPLSRLKPIINFTLKNKCEK